MTRRLNHVVRAAAGSALLVLLTACSSFDVPEDRYFRLAVSPGVTSLTQPVLTTLVVERFDVEGITAQRPIVHSQAESDYQLRQYVYAFWADSPSRMLQDVTVDALRAAGVAERVVTPGLRIDTHYRLTGRVRQLEHVRGEPGVARVSLEFSLTQADTGELLLLDEASREVAVQGQGVAPVVVAMNGALNRIYAGLIGRIAALK